MSTTVETSGVEVSASARTIAGRYRLGDRIAAGSMGTVYEAHDLSTGATVALKRMRVDVYDDPAAQERFEREARASAMIGHPGVVRTLDSGVDEDGWLFLVMERLYGETMRQWMDRGGGGPEAIGLVRRLLEPLAAAHGHGVVHRDVKPANVFLTRSGEVKLLDFGLVRDPRSGAATRTGLTMGTPHYMSPEQSADPRDCGPQSDVWSIGVMLYEILAGHVPHDGETPIAVCLRAIKGERVPLAEAAPDAPSALVVLVERCLSTSAERRPADASAVARALDEHFGPLPGTETGPPTASPPTTDVITVPRSRAWIGVVAVAVAAVLALWFGLREPEPEFVAAPALQVDLPSPPIAARADLPRVELSAARQSATIESEVEPVVAPVVAPVAAPVAAQVTAQVARPVAKAAPEPSVRPERKQKPRAKRRKARERRSAPVERAAPVARIAPPPEPEPPAPTAEPELAQPELTKPAQTKPAPVAAKNVAAPADARPVPARPAPALAPPEKPAPAAKATKGLERNAPKADPVVDDIYFTF